MAKLEQLTGCEKIKKQIAGIVKLVENNYEHELKFEAKDDVSLNRLFLGNPGTGKTSVANLYGSILNHLRLLSNGDVVYKVASDFMGSAVGESQKKTKAILELAKGKVLIIDEVYGLDDALYGKNALDTIVETVTGKPGEDIAVILAGYRPQVEKMLGEQNPGLARRFHASHPFVFEDFSDDELMDILSEMCDSFEVHMPLAVKTIAVKQLAQQRALPNFGNAGAMTTMLTDAKARMSERLRSKNITAQHLKRLEEVDLDEASDGSGFRKKFNPMDELNQLFGMEDLQAKLKAIEGQLAVRAREGRSTDDLVGNYIFTGPSGTGKTTVAQIMGKILHGFGLLARSHVEVTSALDLTGQYVGHTTPRRRCRRRWRRPGAAFCSSTSESRHNHPHHITYIYIPILSLYLLTLYFT